MSKQKRVERFGVKSPDGRHSSVWSVWTADSTRTTKAKSCVYVAARTLGGTVKISLHEDGDWRSAYTSQYVKKRIAQGTRIEESRTHDRWQRPPPDRDGLTLALRIVIPSSDLRNYPLVGSQQKEITWITTTTVGTAIEFWLVFSGLGSQNRDWPFKHRLGTKSLALIQLVNGEVLWIVYSDVQTTLDFHQKIEIWKQEISRQIPTNVDVSSVGLRLVVLGEEKDCSRILVDLVPN